jgi:hypothetical protein
LARGSSAACCVTAASACARGIGAASNCCMLAAQDL